MEPTTGPARRIAWLVPGNDGYGVRRAVLGLTRELTARGWVTPIVTLTTTPFSDDCRAIGLEVIDLDVGPPPAFDGPLWAKPLELARAWRFQRRVQSAVESALRTLSIEAVHVVRPNLVALAGAASRRVGVACFWRMPKPVGDRYPLDFNRRLFQWVCWRNRIQPIANSAYTASTLGNRPVAPVVMHLSADPDRFDPTTVNGVGRHELGIPEQAIVFAMVGRLIPDKAQDRVLQAMAQLGTAPAPLHLLVVGGPLHSSYADSLRSMAQELGLSDRLHLIGAVDQPEEYYGAADVAINAYVGAESFGLSVVEAMMMGRPALVHARGGPGETVVDGVTGWHMPDPSVDSLIAGLERCLADRHRWEEMGEAARRRTLEYFTIRVQTERYMDIVQARLGTLTG
ncbi:MAG: glycosyltransferase family 4 protein [Acidimicrobiia bacterium]|nr:glycosyltransferase family 4 protein [Acidimicrobiia bacterium]